MIQKLKSVARLALCAFTLAASTLTSSAAVEAVQIRLQAGAGETLYSVPNGKVLIIEHVVFSDYWDIQDEDKKLVLRHGGSGTTGTVWNTTQNYNSNWNQLLRPLRLPEGKAIACPFLDNSLFSVFIYGRLADEGDLFAKIDTEIKEVGLETEGDVKTIQGTVDLATKHPAMVSVEESSDLQNWSMVEEHLNFTNSSFDFFISSDKPKNFVRTKARALPEEELPPFPLLIVLPGI